LERELEAVTGQPPVELYHYTDASGFLGIVKNHSLWATNALFLNDAEEIKYGISIFLAVIDSMRKSRGASPNSRELTFFEIVDHWPQWMSDATTYVCCLSAAGNQLSQWRAYSGQGTGYSIVFPTSKMNLSAQSNPDDMTSSQGPSVLVKVIYEREQQFKLVEMAVKIFLDYIGRLSQPEWDRQDMTLFEPFYYRMESLLTGMKRHSFSEEEEWRLVHRISSLFSDPPKCLFRTSRSGMLLPYCSMVAADDLLPIARVIVGPSNYSDLTMMSAKECLRSNGYENTNVESCNIPLREL